MKAWTTVVNLMYNAIKMLIFPPKSLVSMSLILIFIALSLVIISLSTSFHCDTTEMWFFNSHTKGIMLTLVTPSGTGSKTLRWSSLGIWECNGSRRYWEVPWVKKKEKRKKEQYQWVPDKPPNLRARTHARTHTRRYDALAWAPTSLSNVRVSSYRTNLTRSCVSQEKYCRISLH